MKRRRSCLTRRGKATGRSPRPWRSPKGASSRMKLSKADTARSFPRLRLATVYTGLGSQISFARMAEARRRLSGAARDASCQQPEWRQKVEDRDHLCSGEGQTSSISCPSTRDHFRIFDLYIPMRSPSRFSTDCPQRTLRVAVLTSEFGRLSANCCEKVALAAHLRRFVR